VELQIEVEDLALVEAVVGEFGAVGGPPNGGGLVQFLAVNPGGRAVFNAGLFAAVGCDGEFGGVVQVGDPEIVVAIDGLEFAVGRSGGSELTTAFGTSRAA